MFKIMTGQYCNIMIVLLQSFNVFYLLIFSYLFPDYHFFVYNCFEGPLVIPSWDTILICDQFILWCKYYRTHTTSATISSCQHAREVSEYRRQAHHDWRQLLRHDQGAVQAEREGDAAVCFGCTRGQSRADHTPSSKGLLIMSSYL